MSTVSLFLSHGHVMPEFWVKKSESTTHVLDAEMKAICLLEVSQAMEMTMFKPESNHTKIWLVNINILFYGWRIVCMTISSIKKGYTTIQQRPTRADANIEKNHKKRWFSYVSIHSCYGFPMVFLVFLWFFYWVFLMVFSTLEVRSSPRIRGTSFWWRPQRSPRARASGPRP